MNLLQELRERVGPEVTANIPMARHTTLKVGGPAEFFVVAHTANVALKAADAAHDFKLPLFVFGGGSNLLVADQGIKGIVVMMANRDIAVDATNATVTCGAGATTGLASVKAADAGLTGFGWAVGVPGTIGGAVRGNAGAYGGDMAGCVQKVRALHRGRYFTLSAAECDFTYRHSKFKNEPDWIVLEATLQLAPSPDPAATKAKLRQILLDRKAKQPVEFPTAGCMFTNWQPPADFNEAVFRRALDLDKDEAIPRTPQGGIPAGWIVDRAGLKGMATGHVSVSEKHGNFFITDGKASAEDVVQLTAALKTRVRNRTEGVVQLMEEVEYVGF